MVYKVVADSSSDLRELEGVAFASVPLKIVTDEREFVDGGVWTWTECGVPLVLAGPVWDVVPQRGGFPFGLRGGGGRVRAVHQRDALGLLPGGDGGEAGLRAGPPRPAGVLH